MKMPTRPRYPDIKPRPDIFGLYHVTLIHRACETEAELQQRIAKVEAGVKAAYDPAVHHLGETAARSLFVKMTQAQKRGRGKALAPDRDARLLEAYDTRARGESITSIARRLRAQGTKLGNTAPAIEKQIRKLVKERTEREHKAKVEARRWRMATRNDPPTLLAGVISRRRAREK